MTAVCTWPVGEIRDAPDPDELTEARPFELPLWAMDYRGDPTRKLLLLTLALKANSHGVTWVGQDTLAEVCCVSVSTIIRHLATLEDEQMIRRFMRYDPTGRKKHRMSDVTIMAPCLPATYLAKCEVGVTREKAAGALPDAGPTLHGCEVGLTSTNDLPCTGATLHRCNDLPCMDAADLPCTGARGSISKDLEEGSVKQQHRAPDSPDASPSETEPQLPIEGAPPPGKGKKLKPSTVKAREKGDQGTLGGFFLDWHGAQLWGASEADALHALWSAVFDRDYAPPNKATSTMYDIAVKMYGFEDCAHAIRGMEHAHWHRTHGYDLPSKILTDDPKKFLMYVEWGKGRDPMLDAPARVQPGYRERRAPGQHHGPTGVLPDLDAYEEMARTWGKRR